MKLICITFSIIFLLFQELVPHESFIRIMPRVLNFNLFGLAVWNKKEEDKILLKVAVAPLYLIFLYFLLLLNSSLMIDSTRPWESIKSGFWEHVQRTLSTWTTVTCLIMHNRIIQRYFHSMSFMCSWHSGSKLTLCDAFQFFIWIMSVLL